MLPADLQWSLYRISQLARKLRRAAKDACKGWNNEKLLVQLKEQADPEDYARACAYYFDQRGRRLFLALDIAQIRRDQKADAKAEAEKSGWIFEEWKVCMSGPSEIEYDAPDGGRDRIAWMDSDEDQRQSSERIVDEHEVLRRHKSTNERRKLKRKNAIIRKVAERVGTDVPARELMKCAQIELFPQEKKRSS